MKGLHSLFLCAGLALAPLTAFAQDYPTRTVNVVVAFSPGASVDNTARFTTEGLRKLWTVPISVENRSGAGGAIGTAHVSQSAPDGYTLLVTSSAYTTNPAIRPDLAYDPVKDLEPVAMIGRSDFALVVGPRVKAANLKEFIEEAKSREMFYATAGMGTSVHFAAELLNSAAGINMTAVHYKGGNEAMVDLIGGRVDAYLGSLSSVLSHVRSGALRAIAVTSDVRNPALPDVPTTGEDGVESAETGLWIGVFAPAGTPSAIVDQLNRQIVEAASTPEAVAFFDKQGMQPSSMNAADFKNAVHSELAKWRELATERSMLKP